MRLRMREQARGAVDGLRRQDDDPAAAQRLAAPRDLRVVVADVENLNYIRHRRPARLSARLNESVKQGLSGDVASHAVI